MKHIFSGHAPWIFILRPLLKISLVLTIIIQIIIILVSSTATKEWLLSSLIIIIINYSIIRLAYSKKIDSFFQRKIILDDNGINYIKKRGEKYIKWSDVIEVVAYSNQITSNNIGDFEYAQKFFSRIRYSKIFIKIISNTDNILIKPSHFLVADFKKLLIYIEQLTKHKKIKFTDSDGMVEKWKNILPVGKRWIDKIFYNQTKENTSLNKFIMPINLKTKLDLKNNKKKITFSIIISMVFLTIITVLPNYVYRYFKYKDEVDYNIKGLQSIFSSSYSIIIYSGFTFVYFIILFIIIYIVIRKKNKL